MILVVGPNLAIDHTVDVPGFQTGRIFRTGRSLAVAGGKGANVARALRALGAPVHLVGLVAGWAGRFIRENLADEGIPATLVEVGGLSRTCTLIVDSHSGDATVINGEGDLSLTPEQRAKLDRVLDAWIPKARVVVCSGSLPPALPDAFHAQVVERARRAGAITIVDASGEPLRLAVEACPHLIKPNRSELETLAALDGAADPASLEPEVAADGADPGNLDRLVALAQDLLRRGVGQVVVSQGAAGAMAVTPQGVWRGRAPQVPVVDPIGAGDSMVAALSAGLYENLGWPELLARAIAAGSTDVTTFGGGLIQPETFARLRQEVTVSPLGPA
ncbi:MAG: 1-phosphofructokinase family hexose kinase [Firmicutes bacterium]|nr:1-phosphofructokinase family hexose kinase [Bacillota bacterium]